MEIYYLRTKFKNVIGWIGRPCVICKESVGKLEIKGLSRNGLEDWRVEGIVSGSTKIDDYEYVLWKPIILQTNLKI